MFGVEELEGPAQGLDPDPTEHRKSLLPRPPHPASMPDLTNALVDERAQIPTVTLQGLVKAFPEEWSYTVNPKQDVQQAHMGLMVRCPQAFGHTVYLTQGRFKRDSSSLLQLKAAYLSHIRTSALNQHWAKSGEIISKIISHIYIYISKNRNSLILSLRKQGSSADPQQTF